MAGGEPGEKGGARSRFITWVLIGTGAAVAFLSLCQRQKTLDKLTEWEFQLRAAGKVLYLCSWDDLRTNRVPGLELVEEKDEPELAALADGTDAAAFAEALRSSGYGGVVVDSAREWQDTDTVREKLARYSPGAHFRTLMLRPKAGLFAPAEPFEAADDVLGFLLGAARSKLLGVPEGEIRVGAPSAARGASCDGGCEIALQLEGLAPREVRSAQANRIRQDVYASGVGPSLLDATLEAAERLAGLWEKSHAQAEGPLPQALARLRIELHVLYDFALVDHRAEGSDDASYEAFMGDVLHDGIYGLAINWTPPRDGRALGRKGFRLRLPSDAVYWSRQTPLRMLERIIKDGRLGKVAALRENEHVSLDRFRSVHVIEAEPAKGMIHLERGIARELPVEEPRSLLARVAERIARDTGGDGAIRQSHYPVRDMNWLGGEAGAREDAEMHALGVRALYIAAAALGRDDLRTAADRALGRMIGWVRHCSGVAVDLSASDPPELPAISWNQRIEHCGPLNDGGAPVAVSGYTLGPGGDEVEIPDDIAFVVHAGTARLSVASLMLMSLLDHLGPDPAPGRLERLGPLVRGLVNFILLMQRSDGTFQPHFVTKDAWDLYRAWDQHSAGMALLALSRVQAHAGDERIEPAIERGLAALADKILFQESVVITSSTVPDSGAFCRKTRIRAPWLAFAALAEHSPRPCDAVREAGILGPKKLVEHCLVSVDGALEPDLAGGYLAGERVPGAQDVLAAAAAAAALDLAPGDPGLQQAAELGLALARRLVVTPGVNDHFLPAPETALGGVGRSLLDHRQRPDQAFAVVALLAIVAE
jgi:hypothetical protein